MKRNLHDIDKLFRDGLDDHPEPAPPGVWDAINNDLDKKQAIVFRDKYMRLRRLAAALLIFMFAGIASLLYVVKTGNRNTGIAQTKTTVEKTAPGNGNQINTGLEKNERTGTAEADTINNTATATAPVPHIAAETVNPSAVAAQSGSSEKELPAADNNKLVVKTSNEKVLPAIETKRPKVAPVAGGNHLSNPHGKTNINQRQALTRGKYAARNKEEQLITTAGHKQPSAYSAESENEYGNKQAADKLTGSTIHNKRTITSIENSTATSVKTLVAYTETVPLLLPAMDAATPGPLVAIRQAPFLNSIIVNDSLVKAAAMAKKKAVSKHPVSLMVFGSPNHSFRRLEDDNLLAGPGRDKRVAEREERRESSFSAGVLVNYGLSKKIILQSGIVFTSAKTSISPKIIYARRDYNGHTRYEFNCSSGYSYISPKTGTTPAVGDSVKVMASSATINYIGIPVSVNYVWQKGRLLVKPGIGVSVNFLTSSNATTNLGNWAGNKQAIASIRGLRTAYLDASIGLGAEWMVSKRIAIGVRPLLRMALTSINKNTPVRAYQNFMSLETGLKINL